MPTFSQDLIFTVLPFGQSKVNGSSYFDFSVIISPRLLSTTSAATQLSSYPDWSASGHTWPDTVATLASSFALTVQFAASHTFHATLVGAHAPDAARFTGMLPGTTPVTPYVYQGFENRKIRSAPVGSAVDLISALYGRYGATSPTTYPSYESLVPAALFGALGFEQDYTPLAVGGPPEPGIQGNGPARKQTLEQALERALLTAKAIPYNLSGIASSIQPAIPGAATSLAFLQHQRFLQRGLSPSDPAPPPITTPKFDFHQIVGAANSLPTLMRVLGLVLDFRAGPISQAVLDKWASGHDLAGTAHFALDSTKLHSGTKVVLPAVQCTFGTGVFRPAPMSANTDLASRMLKLGDPSLYRIVRVDCDGSVVKAMQFANSVTRSRKQGKKLSLSTPSNFALPALRTGGFAIARSGRAVQMAALLKRQTTQLQAGYFSGTVVPPVLYEEDLTRGYRIDILHRADKVWRSLMWREGTITVDGTSPITVLEEDTVVPAPTTASRLATDPGDLYLQETLTRWDGWSLAVPRLGMPFQDSDPSSPDPGSSGFHVTTAWQVPGSSRSGATETKTANAHRLPRLRFGESYQVRARAVDLAGNSISVANAPAGATVVSAPLQHLRFEPVPAPRVLLVSAPLPGGSEEVVVVRSESATVDGTSALDNATSVRLLVPAPSSVALAEQHKAFDLATTGLPMNQAAALYQDVAKRDGTDPSTGGVLLHPTEPHGTANPYHFPGFLPIQYLPEYIGRIALVRHLPVNSHKATVASLPFDTAGKGWPKLQATRIVLSRGSAANWATRAVTDPTDSANVTTELDLVLGKGDMVTTLVNCRIGESTAKIMAIWEWIHAWAAKHKVDPAPAWKAILAGEHWMVTPWRPVTFIHAVRTPLKKPRLFLAPKKTAIGQTDAVFDGRTHAAQGSVLMSRKSTARIDVDGTWSMPVDTGTNTDPVTPQHFAGHAFTIELSRTGTGVDPTALTGSVVKIHDADNFLAVHEFNDTKYRAVTYKGTATSYYVEYFRQQLTLPLTGNAISALKAAPVKPGVAFEASTVKLTLHWTENGQHRTRALVAVPPGTAINAPAPTPGDFLVIEDPTLAGDPAHATNGTVQVLTHSATPAPAGATVEFSYVGPTIHTYSDPTADKTTSGHMHVANSKRPAAPSVRYVVPIYARTTSAGKVIRKGGALRVYLDRPWWSSGDSERLGVVCWHKPKNAGVLPASTIAPYVTLWGFDPVYKSTKALPGQPTPSCFPLSTAQSTSGALTIDESSDHVDVAGHDVGFDPTRNLWYCDIRVTGPNGKALESYTPFIRFAFARYQPHSITGAHLSKVVVVDYAQLAPNRSVTMSGSGTTSRTVTVVGRAAVGTNHAPTTPSRMLVTVEQRDTRIADDALAWAPVSGLAATALHTSVTDSDYVTWHGSVALPKGNSKPLRLTFDEYERIGGGNGLGRLVFTESIAIS